MKRNSKVVQELRRIAKENEGVLQPELVVQAARLPSSPLHSHFTWDNGDAAEKYRLIEAQKLIRTTIELLPCPDGSKRPVRVFVSLRDERREEESGYRLMTEVMDDTQMRQQLLNDALADLEAFQKRYESLQELAEVFTAVRKVRSKLKTE